MVSYSTSIATMAVFHTVYEIHRLFQKSPPPCIQRPIRGETVGVKQQLSVTKN